LKKLVTSVDNLNMLSKRDEALGVVSAQEAANQLETPNSKADPVTTFSPYGRQKNRGEAGAMEYKSTKWIPFREECSMKVSDAVKAEAGASNPTPYIFSLSYSDNGKYLAAASAEGIIRVFDQTGRFCWKFDNGAKDLPTTVCTWRPMCCPLKTGSVLVTGSVNGEIVHWHAPSKKAIYKITEKDNQIYTISYCHDGTKFATAGKDYTVRVYDEETKALLISLEKGVLYNTGHSNRIYASKWKDDEENVLVTGGWDNNVMIWDVRMKNVARTIFGPHICGKALDIQNQNILTGSWRQKDALETWDFRSGKRLSVISDGVSMVYSAQYTGDREGFVVAGGTGINEARIYNMNDTSQKSAPMTLTEEKGIDRAGIYATAVYNGRLAIAGNSSVIKVFKF